MNRPLKEQVQAYYKEFELSETQIMGLENHQKSWSKKRTSLLGVIAASLVIFSLIGYFWKSSPAQMNLATLPKEIAYHHNKKMDSEIKTSSYSEMKVFLSKLDFNLIQSTRLPSEDQELLGGRYCSLQRRLAAQIKLKNKKNNKTYTLYQLARPENMSQSTTLFEGYSEGAKVKIWSENDLLLGIAGDE